jgi:hypothetical protein
MKKTADLKRKKLELSQETIRALTAKQLAGVEGGIETETPSATLQAEFCTRIRC